MQFSGVNKVEIKRSIHLLGATASINLPVTALLRQKGKVATMVETAKQIKVGDSVQIELGYNNRYAIEFVGFVKQINLRTPVEVECEDYFYQTRLRTITTDGKISLEALLKKCSLSIGYCTALTLEDFEADQKPVSWLLGKLKTDYGLAVWFDHRHRIYAAAPTKIVSDKVQYRLRYNVISDDDLIFHRADDMQVQIKAICIYKDGTKVEAKIGTTGGTEKTLYFYDVASQNELATLAHAELKRHSYDGYEGTITTFLNPNAIPTMVAVIVDDVYNERSGNYLIESVTTSFSTSGARRKVEIGIKIE